MQKTYITVIGAGVVGLAITYELSKHNKDILVLERHDSFGRETSSRNSEVIHAGLYYAPHSLKADTCIRGNRLLYELCKKHDIAHKKLGKLVVASGDDEIKKIESIYENAQKSGVRDLKFLGSGEISGLEPDIRVKKALFSPDSGIIDTHGLMKFFYKAAEANGVIFSFSSEAAGIEKKSGGYAVTVKEPGGELFKFETRFVVNAAGLSSDKVAAAAGMDIEKLGYKISYCKGQYFRIKNSGKFSIKRLIYPPATKIDLGIHITPDLAGSLRLGPDAKYIDHIDYSVNEEDKKIFLNSAKRFLPALEIGDLISDTCGIRPKLQEEGEDFRDFVIREEGAEGLDGFINLIGIESPGLTGCLAIAEIVNTFIKKGK
ncbi:MAG: FAD-dependent oxidoreductase [Candidatus Omnitrophica bacterium CG11_big_fil_rev_8_21_14_0_20_42_13]|uniref:FAD-dependent oxidoreductase n=1 Tax=Candidatus Ghiorseimicrobium undicola TaxID=1974746 RepID=A0A2H0M0W2_9BACT|nr:MAG: FAD-dependent oxidoreductase [Candidatus Omnitrophica bacterium CG11_big_fil_rev_8_21_14_0_20_42_13]